MSEDLEWTREQSDGSIPEEYRELARGLLPPGEPRPRVLIRRATDKELLVSGMLGGGSDLAGRPVSVLAPFGKGSILLLANSPIWQTETRGSCLLLFNAAVNYGRLAVKKAEQKDAKRDSN